ncbi:MAG: hypothetical protein KDD44_03525 [Bdellovibrionales bacterium]|nr:hypothetical protein [Bdellovibrionales bacterium]
MLKKITFLNLVTAAWLLFCASASKVSAQTLYFDDQDAGFSTTGSWSYNPSKPGAWNNDHTWSHFDYPGNGDTVGAATWSLGSLVGLYDVKVFFHEHSNRAPDAKYQVTYDSGQNSGDIVVDQRNRSLYSPDFEGFVSLGQYCNPSSVSLSNIVTQGQNPDSTYYGFVVADAVKLERLDDCPPDVPPAPGPVNFGPGVGSDMMTTYLSQQGLFVPHGNVCDLNTEEFIEIGGTGVGFCIERTERAPLTWEEARDVCLSVGKRLPEASEWKFACRHGSSLQNMTNNAEWASNFGFVLTRNTVYEGTFAAAAAGSGDCQRLSYGFIGTAGGNSESSYAFRCLR